jgi:transposase-like protein
MANNPVYFDEERSREYMEKIRWPNGRFCTKCGECERTSFVKSKNHRPGLYYCNSCKSTFTVTTGTIFHGSKVSLNRWLYLIYLMSAHPKGINAMQVSRMIGVTYKTLWFMCHRLREAMIIDTADKLGGEYRPVEIDETYWGNKGRDYWGKRGWSHKMKIVSIVERDGQKRSFHVQEVNAKTITPLLKKNIHADSRIMTDEAKVYVRLNQHFYSHESVNHSKREYARDDVTTNTVEGSFSSVKRAFYGIFHSVSSKHLQRYLNELDFKWNHPGKSRAACIERVKATLKGAEGKRLKYRDLVGQGQGNPLSRANFSWLQPLLFLTVASFFPKSLSTSSIASRPNDKMLGIWLL